MTMPLDRRRPTIPGLVRLLADLPRERLGALAAAWDARPGEGGSLLAGLYHQMTDSDALASALEGRTDADRLVVQALALARAPVSVPQLARRVPFDDETLAARLADLERIGLVWRNAAEQADERVGATWFVPMELRGRAGRASRRRRGVTTRPASVEAADGIPRALPEAPGAVLPGGEAPDVVTGLADGRPTAAVPRPEPIQYAEHCGIALGVWERRGEGVVAGPRRQAWRALDQVGRLRALARLWLVDDEASEAVPEPTRHALWQALRRLAPGRWYDLDQLGHLAARLDGTRSIGRHDLERALATLAWIGVVDRAIDQRGRLAGVRVSDGGYRALN